MWGYLPAVQVLWTQENRGDLGAGGSPCSAGGTPPEPFFVCCLGSRQRYKESAWQVLNQRRGAGSRHCGRVVAPPRSSASQEIREKRKEERPQEDPGGGCGWNCQAREEEGEKEPGGRPETGRGSGRGRAGGGRTVADRR